MWYISDFREQMLYSAEIVGVEAQISAAIDRETGVDWMDSVTGQIELRPSQHLRSGFGYVADDLQRCAEDAKRRVTRVRTGLKAVSWMMMMMRCPWNFVFRDLAFRRSGGARCSRCAWDSCSYSSLIAVVAPLTPLTPAEEGAKLPGVCRRPIPRPALCASCLRVSMSILVRREVPDVDSFRIRSFTPASLRVRDNAVDSRGMAAWCSFEVSTGDS